MARTVRIQNVTEGTRVRHGGRTVTGQHVTHDDCPACVGTLTSDDLPDGTRVRVPHRGDATGTVVRRLTAPTGRTLLTIAFDGAGEGLNYPEQVERLDVAGV